jgi:uncharacterized membrane protein YfcA
LLIAVGVLIGFLSGFFGIGGGTFLVPLLVVAGFSLKTSIGISVIQMVFTSIYGSYLNFKAKSLDFADSLSIAIGGFVGAFFSGYIVSYFSEKSLATIFLLFILFAIYKFFYVTKSTNKESSHSRSILFILGFFIGMFAISIGVGGSLILTPILVGYLGYQFKDATSLGLFFVIFSSISGLISLSMAGILDYESGVLVGVSSLIGVYFGIKFKNIIDTKHYRKALIYLYIMLFFIMFYKMFV